MTIVVRPASEQRAIATPIEVRRGGDAHSVRARVLTYNREYDSGRLETFAPGVFATSLQRNPDRILLFREHDHAAGAIGTPVAWIDDDTELVGEWRFASTDWAKQAMEVAEQGLFGGVSVGFQPPSDGRGQEWSDDFSRVRWTAARLFEVSLVSIPALEDADILSLRSAGVPRKNPRAEAAKAMLATMRAGML